MHDHCVGRPDFLAVGCDVVHAVLPAVFETRLADEATRLFLPVRGELDVDGPVGTGLQQLDLERADAAADLEDGRSFQTARAEEVHDPRLVVAEALLPVTASLSPSRLLPEELL